MQNIETHLQRLKQAFYKTLAQEKDELALYVLPKAKENIISDENEKSLEVYGKTGELQKFLTTTRCWF